MKINWGHRIAGVYILFVIGILYLVYRANNEEHDLVTEDYYGEELKYQSVIDQKDRVARLSAPPKMEVSGGKLLVSFPTEFDGTLTEGELYLYCPSNQGNDLRRSFSVTNGAFALQLPNDIQGLYDIKLTWKSGGKTYFQEQKQFF
ncbi:FixH family protein [Paracnuella aquatica]|uniref:FixH family protein n=1 Tax=Paracnuella aquatica TaxID=2268757 RepID=UPI000DEF4DBA|nr:FixH family protein [Paracnuella aquatica]RPD47358.1 hypothetical protein DRJ53_12725 [Paracnuella aquatica]